MQKSFILALGAVALATGCHAQERTVAASEGCSQVADSQRVAQQVLAPGNVYAADEAQLALEVGRASVPTKLGGAELRMHAQPGMSAEYLERSLRCHAAGGATVGENDPFHPDTGRVEDVQVRPVGGSYAVLVTGSDKDASEDILRRARSIAGGGTVTIEQVASSSGGGRF